MKIYLAGPMSGLPQSNFPAFDEAAAVLRQKEFDVVSPAEIDSPEDYELAIKDLPAIKTWGDFLSRDVKLIADDGIQGIVFLPGWEKSRGERGRQRMRSDTRRVGGRWSLRDSGCV